MKKKWIILAALLVLGLILLLATELYWSRKTEIKNAGSVAENLARVLERHALSTIEKIDLVLTHLQPGLEKAVASETASPSVEKELSAFLSHLPESQSLRVINAEGLIIYDANGFRSATRVIDRPYFIEHRTNANSGLVISEPIFARFTSNWVITVSRRLNTPEGKFAGIVQAAVRADYFENFYQTLNVGSGTIALYDRDENLIARVPKIAGMVGKSPGRSVRNSLMDQGVNSGTYESVSNVDHVLRIHSFRKVNGLPLVVLAGISEDDVLLEWKTKAAIYVFALTVLLILIIALVISLRRESLVSEKISRIKSAFLANMSHEIRTPLNAIIGLTHLIKAETTTPTQRAKLEQVSTAARHLLTIISDILDLSKIDAGKFVLDQQEFSFAELFSNVKSILSPAAEAKGLGLVINCSIAQQRLLGDPTRIAQIVLNLGSNAIKFSDQGEITFRTVVLKEDQKNMRLRIEVEDRGIGIDPSVQGRLFDAFEQADSSTTRQHGGSGLGLAIARKLSELMGGTAGVESKLGQGSLFWFSVALEKSQQIKPLPGPASMSTDTPETILRRDFSGIRVLIVEDEPINREIAAELLEDCGFQVDVAANGREAVEKINAARYQLVLMDMQMPVMDGLQATRQIRQVESCRNIPIIALTANAFQDDREACLTAGMSDYLSKPVNPDLLYKKILAWLQPAS